MSELDCWKSQPHLNSSPANLCNMPWCDWTISLFVGLYDRRMWTQWVISVLPPKIIFPIIYSVFLFLPQLSSSWLHSSLSQTGVGGCDCLISIVTSLPVLYDNHYIGQDCNTRHFHLRCTHCLIRAQRQVLISESFCDALCLTADFIPFEVKQWALSKGDLPWKVWEPGQCACFFLKLWDVVDKVC